MKFIIPLVVASSALFSAPDTPDAIAHDSRAFASSLYSTIQTNQTLFSPHSIFSCLSILYTGARGDTASQMSQALHLSLRAKQIPLALRNLHKSMKSEDAELTIANSLWLGPDCFILSDFRHAVEDELEATIRSISFKDKKEALSQMNGWVSEKTNGKIPKLLEEGDISSLTQLVLLNTLYFKGAWRLPFLAEATTTAPFYSTPTKTIDVSMMEQTDDFRYFEDEAVQVAVLPFRGKFSCLIALPKSDTCNFKEWTDWTDKLKSHSIHLKLPKFQATSLIDLQEPLEKLGMKDAFLDRANFSGIDGRQDLHIQKVVHSSFFAIDERGATAAAATGAVMNLTCMPEPSQPIEFHVNRPFFFILYDNQNMIPLMMGKIEEPKTYDSDSH